MSILSTLPVFLLSNAQALNALLAKQEFDIFEQKTGDWKIWSYAVSYQRDSSRPDHIFHQRWDEFVKRTALNIIPAMRLISHGYLEVIHGKLYMKDKEAFFRWQNLRSRMSMLPIKVLTMQDANFPSYPLLAHPHSHTMEDYIRREGLNETHLHLHAYLFPEEGWLMSIYNVDLFLKNERNSFRRNDLIKELYSTIDPTLTPEILAERMKLAASIRDSILNIINDLGDVEEVLKEARNYISLYKNSGEKHIPTGLSWVSRMEYPQRMEEEIRLWEKSFDYIQKQRPHYRSFQTLLHLYLLIKNEYIHLNRHSEERFGFDAFRASSLHSRSHSGTLAYYRSCFQKICRVAHPNQHNCIEVRMPPYIFIERWQILLQLWQSAYMRICGKDSGRGQNHCCPPLILVAHLLKHAPKKAPKGLYQPPLYEEERQEYLREARKLAFHIIKERIDKKTPVGLDAAGSELVLPPEVFAPAYRAFTRLTKINHKTYHCGEDFHHIISGIRAVYEAVEFLDLKNGNRIGHATAIGIPPEIWLQKMPQHLLISRKEWLLDLVFAWKVFVKTDSAEAARIEKEALHVADSIFSPESKNFLTIHTLADMFDSRFLSPAFILEQEPCNYYSEHEREERALITKFNDEHGEKYIALLRGWHTDAQTRRNMDNKLEIETKYLSDIALVKLQQFVQRCVRTRDVIIETLPVSNLRISQYTDIRQHHILRWLGINDFVKEGDVDLNICLGSDDPGIFVTDIRNEYYHLYYLLRNNGFRADQALPYIKRINEAGRIYAFRNIPQCNRLAPLQEPPSGEEDALFPSEDKAATFTPYSYI